MTFVIPVISHHPTISLFQEKHPSPHCDARHRGCPQPFLVPSASQPDRGPHVFIDPMGRFLVQKLCFFFPMGMFIHAPTMCNLYDSFQFTLQLHRTTLESWGRKYLLSKRTHISIWSSAFSSEFLYSLYWRFWCSFYLLFLIFWQGKGRLHYHALKFNLPEGYDLWSSGCKALLCLHQFALQKVNQCSEIRHTPPIWKEASPTVFLNELPLHGVNTKQL